MKGGYRTGKDAVADYLVKPKGGSMKFPCKSVGVTAAVIKGRIRMWEYVKGHWNADRAVEMYTGPLRAALSKAYPEVARNPRKRFLVLEDNDPAGYKARKSLRAKAEAGITTLDLPPRSPDLNVLDYSLWHAINVSMRAQEARFHKDKKETKKAYMKRLKNSALNLPGPVVKKAVRDMKRRLVLIKKAKGGLIEE